MKAKVVTCLEPGDAKSQRLRFGVEEKEKSKAKEKEKKEKEKVLLFFLLEYIFTWLHKLFFLPLFF